MQAIEKSSSRRRFLRQLALGVGTGVGVLAVPAAAKAEFYVCCASSTSTSNGNGCPQGWTRFWCQCSRYGGTDYCTDCQPNGGCYNGPC